MELFLTIVHILLLSYYFTPTYSVIVYNQKVLESQMIKLQLLFL